MPHHAASPLQSRLTPSLNWFSRRALCMGMAALTSGCGNLLTPTMSYRPTWIQQGTLRVAINHGNAVLAKRDPVTGELSGVSVDMARELAQRLHVPVQLIPFDAANKSVLAVQGGQADIGFFAIDPLRSDGLQFTAPYVVIEGAYLVPMASAFQSSSEVDHTGVRVVVAERSAYDLFLSRTIQRATLVRTTRSDQVVDLMLSQQLEVAAGVKQQLERDMQRVSGLRLLKPSFMQIQQAMATSAANPDNVRYLRQFVEELKASGFIQQALTRHRIEGASVAPPQTA